jgi:hypothetical protein
MYSYQFGSVRERRLDLNLTDHIGNAVHNIVLGQNFGASCISLTTVFPSLASSRSSELM